MKHNFLSHILAKSMNLLFVTALVSLLVASIDPPQTVYASDSYRATRTITVEALIDGRSQLILAGKTATWLHLDFAAPGRHEFVNEPTIINGKEWFPTWPDEPDEENRFCNCYSSIYKGVKPGLPNSRMTVNVKILEGRGEVRIVEAATDGKKQAVVIEFDDNPYMGSQIYKIELSISFGGKP